MPFDPTERPFVWEHLIDTTQVTTIPTMLHTITINRPDVGDGALITVYDVADAGDIDAAHMVANITMDDAGDIDAAHMVANITMDDAFFVIPTTLVYDVGLENGLYILFSAGMTTGDITISYA